MSEEEQNQNETEAAQADPEKACCSDMVHIAYRGKADDRLYLIRDRKWSEIRYYQPDGLKAFCAVCRHRVY